MKLFYTPHIDTDIIRLTGEDSRHCLKVLRLKKGDSINLTDGKGNLCDAEIIDENIKSVKCEVLSVKEEYHKRNFRLNIAIAPTKNINRFEWFLEKCTEIGIDEITPIICEHSERRSVNTERLNKILISAMKQSCIAYLPKINPVIDFKTFISTVSYQLSANKFIAVCEEYDNKKHLLDVRTWKLEVGNSSLQPPASILILIGPEGDFNTEEIKFAFDNGFKPVSLSKNRLRTETAGLVACEIINLINLNT